MPFIDLARTRRSVRSYLDKPVEQEKLDLILEAGRIAPTAANKQPQRVHVLTGDEAMALAEQAAPHMMHDAPAAIVATHMMLEATDLGLGTLWVRGFNAPKAHELLGLPASERIVAIIVVGYATEEALARPRTRRKERAETVSFL